MSISDDVRRLEGELERARDEARMCRAALESVRAVFHRLARGEMAESEVDVLRRTLAAAMEPPAPPEESHPWKAAGTVRRGDFVAAASSPIPEAKLQYHRRDCLVPVWDRSCCRGAEEDVTASPPNPEAKLHRATYRCWRCYGWRTSETHDCPGWV
jgi:hypothetical protein